MPARDIIDNRHEKLVSHINRILGSSEAGRLAVNPWRKETYVLNFLEHTESTYPNSRRDGAY